MREWREASSSKSTEEKQQKEWGQYVKNRRSAWRGCVPCVWPACKIAGGEGSRWQFWPKPSLLFVRSSHSYLKWPQRKHTQKFSLSLFLFLCPDNGAILRDKGSGHANDETTSRLHLLLILELLDNKLHSVQSRLQMMIDNTQANTSGAHISHIWQEHWGNPFKCENEGDAWGEPGSSHSRAGHVAAVITAVSIITEWKWLCFSVKQTNKLLFFWKWNKCTIML